MTTFDELFAEHNLTPEERKALVMHLATLRAQKTVQALQDCPHAAPHRYCDTCAVSPCPIGLGPNVAGNRLAEGKSELTGLLGGPIRSEKE